MDLFGVIEVLASITLAALLVILVRRW